MWNIRDQAIVWKCDKPGITPRDVPEPPATAETAPGRLQQMRAMAHDFSAVMMDYRHDPKGVQQSLRLLAQPVHRYSNPGTDVVDRAMFAFELRTDAEVLLLLEARGAKSTPRWQYSMARLNNDELASFYKETEVWRVGRARHEDRNGLTSTWDCRSRKSEHACPRRAAGQSRCKVVILAPRDEC